MSYQVLARKYRPRTFHEVVGQEHVLRALINALDQGRLHHAYLFTGTRGVGKTTLARILAKCLNCEQGVSAIPCEQCTSCQEISSGRFVDLIEVDAASRTKVEDTRELLENVQYAPTRGRYKVYLIDEVHMLSGHSFNALLKTLEEPPPHVKFLLATTDPQRLPITVLSRCLQFNLKNLAPEKINAHLANVLNQEQLQYEPAALPPIAKGANGSLRDALSLLDQAIAYSGGKITEADVRTMLGTIEQTHIYALLSALTETNSKAILKIIGRLAEQAADFHSALEDLLTALHQIALVQAIPEAIDQALDQAALILDLAQRLTSEEVQLFYQIGLIGRRDLPLAPSPRSGFEMVLLRMLSFSPAAAPTQSISATAQQNSNINSMSSPAVPAKPVATTPKTPEKIQVNPEASWAEIAAQLNLSGMTQALAQHCIIKERTDSLFHLLLDASQSAFLNPKQEARLGEALSLYLGKPIKVQISLSNTTLVTPAREKQSQQTAQLQSATAAISQDANIQAILTTFDAKIQPGTVRVKDPDPT